MTTIRWSRVAVVALKELHDMLRDRRTLLMMVLVPALLYPLGGVALSQLARSAMDRIDRQGYVVAIQGPLEPLRAALLRQPGLHAQLVSNAEAALRTDREPAALGLRVHRSEVELPGGRGEQLAVEILYDEASPRSRAGLVRLRKALEAEAEARRSERLAQLQLSPQQITPLVLKERSITSETRAALTQLAPALAILLILLSLMGAFYPAIDLIAGERERGTLEPLLCTPTSRLEIAAGKYVCLAVLALGTCILNLVALSLTTGLLLRNADPPLSLPPLQAALLLLAATPVLLLVSALLLLAAAFAQSFKDAQNLMTPVYLACLLPALAGLVPEQHLSSGLALVPVLSSVLFIKDLLGGSLKLLPGFVAVASGLFYAALAVALAARVFEHAEISGARRVEHGVAALTAQDPDGRRRFTLTGALGVYGLCLALMLHVAPRLQGWNLRLGLLLTEVLLILTPALLALRLGHVPLREGLGLAPITARQAAGAVLVGMGGLGLALWLFRFVLQPLLEPPAEYMRLLDALRPRGTKQLLVLLGIGAILPAVCEESLCRGLLLQAARRTLGRRAAVALSAFLFALLHVDPYRFSMVLLLGCLLGLAAVWAESILASALIHAVNNTLALALGDMLDACLARPGATVHLALLGTAALGLGLGLLLLRPHPRTGRMG
ncbi:MAG: ABC transporter permease subunit/CPBP intramembrane protease [Myxococcales bacterium]|nr:ABC transporter permease subunit [Myxococcota bacterium]MDW8283076.1 ABC transporter permease subunit/CPBP intramembrane protease [Myxococcales bacterium]